MGGVNVLCCTLRYSAVGRSRNVGTDRDMVEAEQVLAWPERLGYQDTVLPALGKPRLGDPKPERSGLSGRK